MNYTAFGTLWSELAIRLDVLLEFRQGLVYRHTSCYCTLLYCASQIMGILTN